MITENDLQLKTKEELAETILAMQQIIAENEITIADKNKTIEYLYEQFRLSRYNRFGSKSEKDTGGAHQLSLFDEAVTPDNTPEIVEADEELTIPEHTRKKKGRKSLPKNLPREQEVYDLPEAEKTCSCGCALTYIGDEISEQLEIIPMKVYIIEHVRKKYACRGCEETVKQASMPKQPIPKSIAAPGLLAHTLVSKFEDHLPLYRQEHILQRVGVDIPRATLSHWVIKCAQLLSPLTKLLLAHIHDYDVAYADESTVQVLKEPGRSAETKSYMWVLGGGPPDKFALVYHYAPSRAHTVPLDLLEDFKGYLHCDGYQAYDVLASKLTIILVACWYHVRRKFKEAQKVSPKDGLATQAIQVIKKLALIEEKAKVDKLTSEQRYHLRQRHAVPILENFKAWLDKQIHTAPPKTLIGEAIRYTLSQWPKLMTYLQDGRLEISNNRTERAIKPFATGRKNWLFANSVEGAKAAAVIYSL
ncbi:MAG: IS66 family transposase, partial [Silvanigrellaceae bacterium]|nr:IS66 family transposase [Silvanigrellaceae bacterium]